MYRKKNVTDDRRTSQLTVAVPIVADSYGAPQEAGGPAQVAGAGVSDVVIATDGMLRGHRDWAGGCAAHDTVSTVGLVRHTSMSTWTHHLRARLCGCHKQRSITNTNFVVLCV